MANTDRGNVIAGSQFGAAGDHRHGDRGGLRARTAQLKEIIERFDLDETRDAVAYAILQRLTLLNGMVDRIGLDESQGPLVQAILCEAEWTCVTCLDSERCRAWLDSGARDEAYREFCPNAALFEHLPRIGRAARAQ